VTYERCLSQSLLLFTITKDPIMPDKSAKGIDRRDLIMASIATVGSAAAVAVKAKAVSARFESEGFPNG